MLKLSKKDYVLVYRILYFTKQFNLQHLQYHIQPKAGIMIMEHYKIYQVVTRDCSQILSMEDVCFHEDKANNGYSGYYKHNIFVLLNAFPNAREYLLLNPTSWSDSPWTLITVFFSHEVMIHLLVNLTVLIVFGGNLEKLVKGRYVLIVYLLTGLIGSISIIGYAAIIQWSEPLAGASAATFGIAGAYTALEPNRIIFKSKTKYWLLSMFLINIILSVMDKDASISGFAHAFGIVSGYVFGIWLKKRFFKYE